MDDLKEWYDDVGARSAQKTPAFDRIFVLMYSILDRDAYYYDTTVDVPHPKSRESVRAKVELPLGIGLNVSRREEGGEIQTSWSFDLPDGLKRGTATLAVGELDNIHVRVADFDLRSHHLDRFTRSGYMTAKFSSDFQDAMRAATASSEGAPVSSREMTPKLVPRR